MSLKTTTQYRTGPVDELSTGSGNTYPVAIATEDGDNRLMISNGSGDWKHIPCSRTLDVPYTLVAGSEVTNITNSPVIHLEVGTDSATRLRCPIKTSADADANQGDKVATFGGTNNLNGLTVEQPSSQYQPTLEVVNNKPAIRFERGTGTNLVSPLDKSIYREGTFVIFTVFQYDNPIVFTDSDGTQYGVFDRRHTPDDTIDGYKTNVTTHGSAVGVPGGYSSRSSIGDWRNFRVGSRQYDTDIGRNSRWSDVLLGDRASSNVNHFMYNDNLYIDSQNVPQYSHDLLNATYGVNAGGGSTLINWNQNRFKGIQIDVDIIEPFEQSHQGTDNFNKHDGQAMYRICGTFSWNGNGKITVRRKENQYTTARLYGFSLGGSTFHEGNTAEDQTGFYLHEVMVFNEVLNISTIDQIGKHLAYKWLDNQNAWLPGLEQGIKLS